MSRRRPAAVALVCVLVTAASVMPQFARTVRADTTAAWTGAGPDKLWSDGLNWASGLPPVSGQDLSFPPNSSEGVNDLPPATEFNSIGASGFCVQGGNEVRLTHGITIGTGHVQFTLPVTLAANQTIRVEDANASLLIDGVNLSASTVTLGGAGQIEVRGVIKGAGGVRKNGAGVATLDGQNIFAGATSVEGGELRTGFDDSAIMLTAGSLAGPSSPVSVAPGATLSLAGANYPQPISLGTAGSSGTAVLQKNARSSGGPQLVGRVSVLGNAAVGGVSFFGPIDGNGPLFLQGATLHSRGGGYTGPLTIGGEVMVYEPDLLGAAATTVVANGYLYFFRPMTVAGSLTLSGGRVSADAAVVSNQSILVKAGATSTIDSGFGAQLSLAGSIEGPGDVSFGSQVLSGDVIITGANRLSGTYHLQGGHTRFVGRAAPPRPLWRALRASTCSQPTAR